MQTNATVSVAFLSPHAATDGGSRSASVIVTPFALSVHVGNARGTVPSSSHFASSTHPPLGERCTNKPWYPGALQSTPALAVHIEKSKLSVMLSPRYVLLRSAANEKTFPLKTVPQSGSVGGGVGAGVVGEDVVGTGVGEGVGEGPVHVTGGLHGPVLRHAGHIAPFVQSGLGERSQLVVRWSLMAQMPAPAPVIWLPFNNLRMCAQGRRTKGGRAR